MLFEANRKVFKYKTVIVQLRENSAASPTANRGDEKKMMSTKQKERKNLSSSIVSLYGKLVSAFVKGLKLPHSID